MGPLPSLSSLMVVVPVTLPVITTWSAEVLPTLRKSTLRVMTPPPLKSPFSVSTSLALPFVAPVASSVAPSARLSVPATDRLLCNEIEELPPMSTLPQPTTFDASSAPDTLLSARVLSAPPPPFSSPMLAMLTSSSVRLSESPASLTPPVIVAPLRTTMLSQPFRPCVWTVEFSGPEPPLNVSVSVPSPPLISVTEANVPPANVRLSFPAPMSMAPETVAPLFRISVSDPAPRATVPVTVAP